MPPPRFITCQLCGRGFGSASIGIHIPQCYDKALKRWQLDPSGPRPIMPQQAMGGSSGRKKGGGFGGGGLDSVPVGTGSTAARSLKANNVNMMDEQAPVNQNLHPCSRCGRKFLYDRIEYHESVCKGDQRRTTFNSTKQRMAEDTDGFGGGYGGGASYRAKGKKGSKAASRVAAPASRNPRAPQSTWRQQHEDFIQAMRAARNADSDSKAMWGNPGIRESRPPATSARGPPAPRRVPASMVKQDQSRRANITSGGRAMAQASSISTPAPGGQGRCAAPARGPTKSRAFGGGGDRFSGYGPGGAAGAGAGGGGGGGGGNYRILNENTSSLGMKQAFGGA